MNSCKVQLIPCGRTFDRALTDSSHESVAGIEPTISEVKVLALTTASPKPLQHINELFSVH
jgi:hypothetical protein